MDFFFLYLQPFFLFAFLFPLSIYFLFFHNKKKKTPNSAHLTDYPILGTLPSFLKNRHRFLEWTTGIHASTKTNTMTFCRPGVQGIITANPMNVEHMLKTNFTNYPKGEGFIFLLQDFLGDGIFNSDGDQWRIQRKTASYEFNTKSLRSFIVDNVRMEIQTRLIPVLQKSAKSGEMVNLQDVLERFAFDNVCTLAFNVDSGCLGGDGEKNIQGTEFMRAFDEAAKLSAGRFMYAMQFLWKVKKFFDVGSEKTLRQSIKKVHDFVDKIIASKLIKKKEDKNDEADLLSRFMTTTGKDWESAKFLRNVAISFILAGRDTTSSALSWFFWLLASHPSVEQNILDELKASRKQNGTSIGDTLNLDELRDLHYLHAAISESMRLYPPVAIDTKSCLEDDLMPDGTFIGKGWFVVYNTFAMGRMENIWGKDCLEYKPERWLENGMFRVESPFRYPVFQAGQRICLGKDMAYIQMKSIMACVLERFEIEVIEKEKEPEYVLSLTLRMKEGLMVRVKERCMSK